MMIVDKCAIACELGLNVLLNAIDVDAMSNCVNVRINRILKSPSRTLADALANEDTHPKHF